MDALIERQAEEFDGPAGLEDLKALRDEIVMRTQEQKEWEAKKLMKEKLKQDEIKAYIIKKRQLRLLKQLA